MIENLKPVARTSLSDGIVEQLIAAIERGELKAGDRIPSEKQLCQQFGVGRTSVREAIRSLSAMGILESHAGEGTFVRSDSTRYVERAFQWGLLLDRKLVTDLADARLMLEAHTAELAASQATAEDVLEIEEALRGMESSISDLKLYLESDVKFHLAVAKATHNTFLTALLSTIRGYMQAWITQTLASSPSVEQRARTSVEQHRRILQAIASHQPDEAREAMRAHILSARVDLISNLPNLPNLPSPGDA